MEQVFAAYVIQLCSLLVGAYEAYGRGPVGWIVSIVAALAGGTMGSIALSLLTLTPTRAVGKLLPLRSVDPQFAASLIVMLMGMVLGAWFALWLAKQVR
jgi:hypothetical protein